MRKTLEKSPIWVSRSSASGRLEQLSDRVPVAGRTGAPEVPLDHRGCEPRGSLAVRIDDVGVVAIEADVFVALDGSLECLSGLRIRPVSREEDDETTGIVLRFLRKRIARHDAGKIGVGADVDFGLEAEGLGAGSFEQRLAGGRWARTGIEDQIAARQQGARLL